MGSKPYDSLRFPYEGRIPPYTDPVHARELDDSCIVIQADGDYADPVGLVHPDYQGRWIAGFAPVGSTGFFVTVQQRYEDALRVDPFVGWNLAVGTALIACLAIAVVFLFLRRRPRGLAIGPPRA